MHRPRPIVVACGVLAEELSSIRDGALEDAELAFVDSMLHMSPARLGDRLGALLDGFAGRPVAIAYGDCCPNMRELEALPGRARTPCLNCCELALGSARFRELRKRGSFFFLPEWAGRWSEIFAFELGLRERSLARSLMRDTMRELVYLDTGVRAVPKELLGTIAEYFGMPLSVERTGVDALAASVRSTIRRAVDAS